MEGGGRKPTGLAGPPPCGSSEDEEGHIVKHVGLTVFQFKTSSWKHVLNPPRPLASGRVDSLANPLSDSD